MHFTRTIFLAAIAAAAFMAAGCSSLPANPVVNAGGTPTAATVANITVACTVDAGLRPTIDALMVLATPDEVIAVKAARGLIDPICANPSASIAANALATFTEAAAQMVNIEGQLVARKQAAKAAAPAVSAASSA